MCSVEIEDLVQLWKESALLDLWVDILKNNFIYLFISVCAASSLLLRLLFSCGVRASHCHGVSCPRAQALDLRLSSWGHGLGSTWGLPRSGI